ncbi:MAG: hypothetical protein ACOZE5_09100 [Verrucomicrobiota bacterium]
MTTLRQNLQSRREAESPASCVTAAERQAALIIASWQGASWVLPWAQFISARLDNDRVELTFASVSVTLTGQNLSALLGDIAAFRLGCLRDLPEDYRQKPVDGQPFISRIEVRTSTPEIHETPA